MERKTVHATLIVLMLSIVPAAAAEWRVYGSYEPNTPYDTSAWMWNESAPPGEKRVYFNVITQGSEWVASGLVYNPNVALLHTQNEPATGEFHEAILGVWTDCNRDGYIGTVETAMREYPSELLPTNSTCAPKTGGTSRNAFVSANYPNNWNGWVSEVIPISRNVTTRDGRTLEDIDARVWGDFERPDERQHNRRCGTSPYPRGTLQSTGGVLNYVDCRMPLLETFNGAVTLAGNPGGLRFADPDNASTGTLGRVATFGSDDSNRSAVRTQNCDANYIVRSGDVLNSTPEPIARATRDGDGGGTAHDFEIRPAHSSPVASTSPTTWTVPGQYNRTYEEVGSDGDCNTYNDRGAEFYTELGEGDNPQIDPKDKRGANWNFFFFTSNRGGAPVSLVAGRGPGATGMPEGDLGTTWGGSRWIGDSLWGSKPGFPILKTDLTNATATLPDAYWLSFYAHVGAATTSKASTPSGGTGVAYGQWACASFTSGIHNGWNCDSSTWYTNPDGSKLGGVGEMEPPEFAYLGQLYELRDVDCYDGSNDLGIPIQPSGFSTKRCP